MFIAPRAFSHRVLELRKFVGTARALSGYVRKPWKSMSGTDRLCWEQLGWKESSWEGKEPGPKLLRWAALDSAQKSVAMHGLKLDETLWDSLIESNQLVPVAANNKAVHSSASTNTSSSMKEVASRMAWTALKVAVPVVSMLSSGGGRGSLAAMAVGQLPTLIDDFSDPIVIPSNGIETILYLDDSGSMSGNLGQGKAALQDMSGLLQGTHTRIVKFGSGKAVVSPRENGWSTALTCLNWNASSGSTYMWKMIEDDVLLRYRPTPGGKLRIIVLTDGFDTDSPGEYHGIRGMDPMMKTLLSKGYDIEFHIVVLGQHYSKSSQDALKRYQHLTEATGGGYMALSDLFYNEKSANVKKFLGNLEASNDAEQSKKLRAEKQKGYLEAAKKGQKEKFDWLKSLPPPS